MGKRTGPRGRGAKANPANRFTRLEIVPDEPPGRVETMYLKDSARTVIARNTSPDIAFDRSLNPYRGCEHGCAYCYARPFHEYLGFSAGLDFETRILVKEDAPELLEVALGKPGYQAAPMDLSGVTDPYQPVERRLELTRRCLEVLARCRHPVVIVTKNALVTRDLDHLRALADHKAVMVWLSITTLDSKLARRLEPRTSSPSQRIEALEKLSAAEVPCGVFVAPVIPGLTDHELPAILEAARGAGASHAQWSAVRLPGAVGEIFTTWLEANEPNRASKVLRRIRSLHGGELDDPRFGARMAGVGSEAEQLAQLFRISCRRAGFPEKGPELSSSSFTPPGPQQPRLF